LQIQGPDDLISSADDSACRNRGEAEMNRKEKAVFAMAALVVAAAAMASETMTYSYDSRGRLVRVVHSGSVNNNVSANYSYDKADNRATVNVVSPNAP